MKITMIGAGAATALLTQSLLWAQGPAPRPPLHVAVLPLLTPKTERREEGLTLSAKIAQRLQGRAKVSLLDWQDLEQLMRENTLNPREFSRPAVLRRIGEILQVDEVVAGRFEVRDGKDLVSLQVIKVSDGAARPVAPWSVARDIVVEPPALVVAPPMLPGQAEELRDSLADENCENAGGRVDAYEKEILDLKARYWALQIRHKVAMSTLKFNPGSTITDPELKKEFYGRMKAWMREEVVPELTPMESKNFAEIDEKAFLIARRCGIL